MFTPSLLKDRVAVITGGGTGLGLAIAARLSELGALVAIGSRSAEHLERGTAELRHAGFDPQAIQLDVRKPEQVDEMVTRVVRHFGTIDILINNAAGNFVSKAEDLSPNGWNAVVGIVLNGSFYCSRAVGRHMIARGGGGFDRVDPRELRLDRQCRHRPFGGGEGGRDVDDADTCGRVGPPQHPRERGRARTDRVRRRGEAALGFPRRRTARHREGAARSIGEASRCRGCRVVSGLRPRRASSPEKS